MNPSAENKSFSKTILTCFLGAQAGWIHAEQMLKNLVILPLET